MVHRASPRKVLAIYRVIMVNRSSPTPPWQQLTELLRARIESGELQPGDRIPSVVGLAQEYELAAGTVRKALTALQREGLIVSRVGWGTFVAERDSGAGS